MSKRRFQTGGYYDEPQLIRPAGSALPEPPQGLSLPKPPVVAAPAQTNPPIRPIRTVAEPEEEETLAARVKALEKGKEKGGALAHITSPWKRALLAGGLGAGMSAGAGGWGALAGGAAAAGLASLLGKKREKPDSIFAKGGSMQMSKSRAPGRRLKFQLGGGVPPLAGSLPPGLPPGGPPGLAGGPPPGLPPGGPPGLGGLPPGPPPPPPMAPAASPPLPPVGPVPPGLADIAGGGPGFPGGPPVPPGPLAPSPQVAAPAAALGAGLPSASPDTLRQGLGRPGRPGRMRKGGAVKAKGKGVLTRRPKISIAIAAKKNPVPTPSPYDMEDAPEPPVARAEGGKIAAKKAKGGKFVMRKRHGGKCDDAAAPKKMAAGGIGKVRKGFPNTDVKKMAGGGKVRGCGAATKGTHFSGIF